MALADTATLAVKLTLDDRGFTGPLSRVQKQIGGLSKGFGRMGKGVGQLGVGFARVGVAAGVAAVGGLALVAREGIKWEQALAGVNKTMDLTPAELEAIGTQIRTLATQIPIGADAIAGLAEQAGALGIAKEDVVEFARVAATLGVTTNVSAEDAATALGGMATILGLTGDEFERFASSLVAAGNAGASTEGQIIAIAERIAGAGATIGLTTEEMLGFSAAAANIQIPPEAAGSSLQKFFIETLKAVREGGAELDTFAKTAGTSASAFGKLFKDDPAAALDAFVSGLAELGKGKRLDVLDDLGFTDIRITRLLLGLAEAEEQNDNLTNSLKITADAWAANTAAAEEADKRYKTVGSKLELLRNQAIESALLIGEGFLPALGRMADKLKTILTDPAQRQTLKDFGKDIGGLIDGIDFNKLLGAAKTTVGVVKSIWFWLSKIPVEITAAVAAFAGLNKISGGLIGTGLGNIVGGLGETITRSLGARAPGGIGKLFAQPVFVTNWPIGMGAGGGGTAVAASKGGIGVLGKLFLVGEAVGLIAAIGEVKNSVEAGWREQTTQISTDLANVVAGGNVGNLQQSLAGIDQGLAALNAQTKPGQEPSQMLAPVIAQLQQQRASVIAALYRTNSLAARDGDQNTAEIVNAERVGNQIGRGVQQGIAAMRLASVTKMEKIANLSAATRAAINTSKAVQAAKLQRVAELGAATKAAVNTAKTAIVSAGHADKNAIRAAVFAARAIVTVATTVNVSGANSYATGTVVRTGSGTKRKA